MKTGDRITHATYGLGTIKKILGEERTSRYVIAFDSGSEQTLKYARTWAVIPNEGKPVIPSPPPAIKTVLPQPKEEVKREIPMQPTNAPVPKPLCSLCGYSEGMDEDMKWCERCMMLSGSIGIAVLATKNTNQLPRLWALARKVVHCPQDEFAFDLENCRYCHALIVMRPVDYKLRGSTDSYCSRECKDLSALSP